MTTKATMMMKRQNGFSLVELMVAMTVTLIVSGAIYGLLTSGSAAFRREPEVADRQQNIRLAMDIISRDVFSAGAALPTYAQAFTREDPAGGPCAAGDGLNGCGVPGSLGAGPAGDRAPGVGGDPSTDTDVLEIVSTTDPCPSQTVCSGAVLAGSAGRFVVRELVPACLAMPTLVLLTDGSTTGFTIQPADLAGGAPDECDGGGDEAVNGNLQLATAVLPWIWPGPNAPPNPNDSPPPAPPVVFLYGAQVVRYRIAPSVDPQDTSPALWRSTSGRYAVDGSAEAEPGDAGFTPGGSPWQLVARGIEDLQVEYMAGDGLWTNRPPVIVNTDANTLVRRVRVTLSARVTQANLQGETAAEGAGPQALRGQLVSELVPRAAFHELQMLGQIR